MSDTQIPSATDSVALTPQARRYLEQTRPWVRIMAMLTFAIVALMLLSAAFMTLARISPPAGAGGMPGMALWAATSYGLIALLYLVPALYLHRYAKALGRLGDAEPAAALEEAIKQQRSFWRFAGIATLVTAAIGLVGVLAALLIPAIVAMAGWR